jgi:hypothetical protein
VISLVTPWKSCCARNKSSQYSVCCHLHLYGNQVSILISCSSASNDEMRHDCCTDGCICGWGFDLGTAAPKQANPARSIVRKSFEMRPFSTHGRCCSALVGCCACRATQNWWHCISSGTSLELSRPGIWTNIAVFITNGNQVVHYSAACSSHLVNLTTFDGRKMDTESEILPVNLNTPCLTPQLVLLL